MSEINEEMTNDGVVERLNQIFQREKCNASAFARKIGVPYQSAVNLLNGRNKPSCDMIVKIVNAFDYVTADWLLMGIERKYDVLNTDLLRTINQQAMAIANLSAHLSGAVETPEKPEQESDSSEK